MAADNPPPPPILTQTQADWIAANRDVLGPTTLDHGGYAPRQHDARALILGLDNAGKTTFLKLLARESVAMVMPTQGFNVKSIDVPGAGTLNLWDLGGGERVRPYWPNYYRGDAPYTPTALVYAIDGSDAGAARRDEAVAVLRGIISHNDFPARCPVLVLITKAAATSAAISVGPIVEALAGATPARRYAIMHVTAADRGAQAAANERDYPVARENGRRARRRVLAEAAAAPPWRDRFRAAHDEPLSAEGAALALLRVAREFVASAAWARGGAARDAALAGRDAGLFLPDGAVQRVLTKIAEMAFGGAGEGGETCNNGGGGGGGGGDGGEPAPTIEGAMCSCNPNAAAMDAACPLCGAHADPNFTLSRVRVLGPDRVRAMPRDALCLVFGLGAVLQIERLLDVPRPPRRVVACRRCGLAGGAWLEGELYFETSHLCATATEAEAETQAHEAAPAPAPAPAPPVVAPTGSMPVAKASKTKARSGGTRPKRKADRLPAREPPPSGGGGRPSMRDAVAASVARHPGLPASSVALACAVLEMATADELREALDVAREGAPAVPPVLEVLGGTSQPLIIASRLAREERAESDDEAFE